MFTKGNLYCLSFFANLMILLLLKCLEYVPWFCFIEGLENFLQLKWTVQKVFQYVIHILCISLLSLRSGPNIYVCVSICMLFDFNIHFSLLLFIWNLISITKSYVDGATFIHYIKNNLQRPYRWRSYSFKQKTLRH